MRPSLLGLLALLAACQPGEVRHPGFDSGDTSDTGELVDTASDDTATDSESDSEDSDPPDTDVDTDTNVDTDTDVDTGSDTGSDECPSNMVLVDDTFCIDAYEATLEERTSGGSWVAGSPYVTVGSRTVRAVVAPGKVPQGYISGDEAEDACVASGKRLCTSTEWLEACQGPSVTTYPYGNTHQNGACNDDYVGGHPLVDYFGTSTGIWDTTHMNDPGINQQANTVAAGGAFSQCVSAWGAYDLHGNLHEWVQDADGTFRGGFYADASINGPGCTYRTGAHARGYHDYSTGFRCCADP